MAKGFGEPKTKKVSKRQKAYLKLIGELLSFPRGREQKVLRDNQHLIDAGLVKTMIIMATKLAEEGERKSAKFLMGIAERISEELEFSNDFLNSSGATKNMSEMEEKEYFDNFLLQMFSIILNGNDDPKATHPILQTYLEKDPDFIQKFGSWIMESRTEVIPKEAIRYGFVLTILGNGISEFPLGNPADNLETAMACFQVALSVIEQNESANLITLKSTILHLLAIAYCNRIRGDEAENIELTICKSQEALQLITRETEPKLWGQIHNSLALAYRVRIWGDKTENLELAITYSKKALQVRTCEEYPEKWAQTQMNLAVAYRHRIKGEKAENLELAITANQAALQVYTRQKFAVNWGEVHLNLGNVYLHRIVGDKSENLNLAIASYKNALQVITKNRFPQKWATAKMNLGNAYRDSQINEALACYRAAFEIFTPTDFPQNCFRNGCNMGYTAFVAELWPEAIEGFAAAVEAIEQSLNWAESEARSQEIQAEAIDVYEKLVTACVKNGELDLAKEYATRSDSVRLVNKFVNNNQDLELDKEIVDFCTLVLRTSLQGDEALYELLEENLDKLDDKFVMVLRMVGEDIKSQIKPEQLPQLSNFFETILKTTELTPEIEPELSMELSIAGLMRLSCFSSQILQFTKGNEGTNIEIAIVGYEVLENIFTREVFPLNWAVGQNFLGAAYIYRFRGDRQSNLEKAIAYFQNALQVLTPESEPKLWGLAQTDLASCYFKQIKGDRSENQEKAISCCQEVLKICTRDRFPTPWGNAMRNLGTIYREKVSGNPVENLETAISCYEQAVQVLTFEEFPTDWGAIQESLGIAYHNRIKGDKLDNLKQAIRHFDAALKARTREDFPEDWVRTLSLLGNVYKTINSPESIERAIQCHQTALEVATIEEMPMEWAMLHTNLGTAYSDRPQGDEISNIKNEINHYETALQVYTPRADPQQWVSLHNNISLCYAKLWETEAEIKHLQLSLEVCTREKFPQDWAKTQYNLGLAYIRFGAMTEAVNSFNLSLEIFTPNTFPEDCFCSGGNLGDLEFHRMRWEEAIKAYELAIEAVEIGRSWTVSEDRRQKIMENVIDLYFQMVQACINAGNLEKALEYAERSKSKRLVDLMASNDLSQGGEISPEVQELLQQYDDLQQQIDQEHHQKSSDNDRTITEVGSSSNQRASLNAYNEKVAYLEAEKQKIWEQLRRLDPVLAGEIQVSAPDITAIQKLIDKPTTAILSFYNTADNTYIFVLRQNQISIHTCSQQGIEILQPWIYESWLLPYLPGENETDEQKEERKSKWYDQMNSILAEIGERLQLDRLITEHLNGIEELILIPHLFLHLIPFAAIPISDSSQYLGDKFLIRYAPSCQILEFCHKRGELETATWQYGTVENAEDNLPFAGFEGEQISQLFNIPETNRLRGKTQATRSNYQQLANTVQLLHSCHHAESRLDNPLESVLKLGDGNITLGQLMSPGWRLPNLSDVFLSCCETGLGTPQITDDILTLATGFLCAGARSVINTLWSVDDLATALVSIFYYEERKFGKSRPQALWEAQMKLRRMTKEEVRKLLSPVKEKRKEAKDNRNQYSENSPEYQEWHRQYRQYSLIYNKILNIQNENPFSHPHYWAAFTAQGL
ncbi:MAG: CHAT domain-containing protein [Cyanobacteriota bacterium]|nr:CHAT domain-containing protein [Cyanobacteriota bacterium]